MHSKKLIFFDKDCPLCRRSVRFVIAQDHHEQFLFAPLLGKTADRLGIRESGTLVLVEENKHLLRGAAVCRIFWLLGGKWRLIGWLTFLPPHLFNLVYRLVAARRHTFSYEDKPIDMSGPHFLD